jgi:hypothetical protein
VCDSLPAAPYTNRTIWIPTASAYQAADVIRPGATITAADKA